MFALRGAPGDPRGGACLCGAKVAPNAAAVDESAEFSEAAYHPQGALDYLLEYAKERQQPSKPIAGFQGVQFMLADMGMRIEAARQLRFFGAAAKCFVSDTAMQVTTDPVQVQRIVMARQLRSGVQSELTRRFPWVAVAGFSWRGRG